MNTVQISLRANLEFSFININASYSRTTVRGVLCDNITENDQVNEYNNTVNG